MTSQSQSRIRKALTVAATLALAIATTTTGAMADQRPSEPTDAFRVLPYLQNPTSTSMTLTWFSYDEEPGLVTVRGPGLSGRPIQTTPEPVDTLDYTEAELAEEIDGLEQGSWLHEGGNVKHTLTLTDLEPDSTYTYMVRQDGRLVNSEFRTAPSAEDWEHIRFAALADSETEPLGRTLHREWAPGSGAHERPSTEAGGAWDEAFGTTELNETTVLRYALTEDEGYLANLDILHGRDPEFILKPGDLVQGGGYQPAWDEFFRINAGAAGQGLTHTPIIPALGNWESFAALNNGYGTPEDRSPVVTSRAKYHTYFDAPENGTDEHNNAYYRIDYGPLTILTLDSNNGEPDDHPDNYDDPATGQEYRGPGTDTQDNFTREEYEAAGGDDLVDFNPGSPQWEWAEENLREAREQGQIIFVQFHHAPFSSGEHGLPMYHELTSGQGATPMRQYHEMFAEYGVAAVLSGHSEMFERSHVDEAGDGIGVTYYDVGVAGDGLRGERRDGPSLEDDLLRYNPYREWTADQDEPEQWEVAQNGNPVLVDGGKHYGHLEVDVERLDGPGYARVTLTPVYSFPMMDEDYQVQGTERRTYEASLELVVGSDGRVISRE